MKAPSLVEPRRAFDRAERSGDSAASGGEAGFEVGVETNGTISAPQGVDWLCVSPKGAAPLVQKTGDELKLVFPQVEPEAQPARFTSYGFQHFFLQPLDNTRKQANTEAAVEYCKTHPQWRLSLQMHKLVGIP